MTILTGITVVELIDKALLDLYRMQFASSAYSRYCKGFREFAEYCESNGIIHYSNTTGQDYFRHRFGLDIADTDQKLEPIHLDVRCTMRLLDDIYQFGYARRNSHRDYRMPKAYESLLEQYLGICGSGGNAQGTLKVKRRKLLEFFLFLEGRGIKITNLVPADISDFIVTLTGFSRATMRIYTSTLRCFLRYLNEIGVLETDLSGTVPWPTIYTEESIPETWTAEELQTLLTSIDRTGTWRRHYRLSQEWQDRNRKRSCVCQAYPPLRGVPIIVCAVRKSETLYASLRAYSKKP